MEEELSVLHNTYIEVEDKIQDGDSNGWRDSATRHYFSALDYSLFGAMLVLSAMIGIYFAFFAKKKQNTISEYLMGGRNMSLAPVAMSLTASYVSGITLLGVPSEVYTYGTQFSALCFATVIAGLFSAIFFIPVFYELHLNTSYEYLGIRFDRKVQVLGSFLFVVTYLLYIPVVIYVPALAINQVSGVNIHLITPIVCLVCIFYTTLGGMKAVVWADALQILLMFGSLFAIIGVGTNTVGGFNTVWQRNADTNRTELFNMDLDPTIRHTFWGVVIGLSFNLTYHFSVNQGMVQRCLVMPNLKQARILIAIALAGVSILTAISTYTGLQMFAAYYDCDQLSTKVVSESDQLLPHYVMEIAKSLPGLPGLFMAGVFSAALSSMSTGLNSMSGVIYEDFISPFMSPRTSEERASFIMKIICAILGIICVGMVFIVENLEGVIQTAWSLEGIACGPKLGIFILGMFYPWASSTGAFAGGITGLILMGVICIGNQSVISKGLISSPKKPISVDGCTSPFNVTSDALFNGGNSSMYNILEALEASAVGAYLEETEAYDVPWIFRISYTWYALIGLTTSVVAGMIATAIAGANNLKDIHINHLTPPVRPLFSSYCKGEGSEHTIKLNGLSSTNTPSQKPAT